MGYLEELIEEMLINEKRSEPTGAYSTIDPRRVAQDLAPDVADRLENEIFNLVDMYLLDNYA